MSIEKIKELLGTELGMTPEQLATVPDSDIEAISKALPADATDAQIVSVLKSDDVLAAMDSGDEDAQAQAIAKAMCPDGKPGKKVEDEADGDDEDEDEDEEDDEDAGEDDEDEGDDEDAVSEADIRAAEQQLADEQDADEDEKPVGRRAKKGLTELIEEDEGEELAAVSGDVVIAGMLKSFDAMIEARDVEQGAEIASLRKSVGKLSKKIDTMLAAVEAMAKQPAGQKFTPAPYRVVEGPLGEGGGASVSAETVCKSVLAAQSAGLVDPSMAVSLIRSSERGGAAWETVAPHYEAMTKALAEHQKPQ